MKSITAGAAIMHNASDWLFMSECARPISLPAAERLGKNSESMPDSTIDVKLATSA